MSISTNEYAGKHASRRGNSLNVIPCVIIVHSECACNIMFLCLLIVVVVVFITSHISINNDVSDVNNIIKCFYLGLVFLCPFHTSNGVFI